MSSGRLTRVGLRDAVPSDAQQFLPDAEYIKRGAEFSSLTGIAMTHLGNGDIFYAVDTTGGNVTITLPAVADTVGQHHIVKRISGGSNSCSIVASEGTAILDGSATHSIAAQYGVRCYFSDGDAWRSTGPNASGGTTGEITAAPYTATVVGSLNTTSVSFTGAQFIRCGPVVTASAFFEVKPTAASTPTLVDVSIPVGGNFAALGDLAGGGAANAANVISPVFIAPFGANARVQWTPSTSATALVSFSFVYRVL